MLVFVLVLLGLGGAAANGSNSDNALAKAVADAEAAASLTSTPCALLDVLFRKDPVGDHQLLAIQKKKQLVRPTDNDATSAPRASPLCLSAVPKSQELSHKRRKLHYYYSGERPTGAP